MARPIEILKLIVRGDTKAAQAELKKLGREAQSVTTKIGNGFRAAGRAIFSLKGAIVGIGFAAALREIFIATTEAERVSKQLDAVLKSTGQAAGFNAEQIKGMAGELQKLTTFDDEAIGSLQNLLLTFTKLQGEEFKGATEVILDMSTALGQDLKQSAIQVGKALNDPIVGASALREVGVSLSESQIELIKRLAETGDVAAAQRVILEELRVEFGGSARAARDTFGGALKSLGNALGDLVEGDAGNLTEAKDGVEELTELLQDPATVAAFGTITAAIVTMTSKLVTLATNFVDLGKGIGVFLAQAATGIENPDDQLEVLNQHIADTEERLRTLRGAGQQFGPGGGAAFFTPNQAEIQRLENLLTLLRESKRLQESGADPGFVSAPAAAGGGETLSPINVTGTRRQVDPAIAQAVKGRRAAVDSLIASLEQQAATEGTTARQIALYRLEQRGATTEDIARANALFDVIEAKQREAQASADQNREAEALQQSRAQFVEAVRQELDPTRALRQELELLQETQTALIAQGRDLALSAEEFAAAQQALKDEIAAAKDGFTELNQFGIQAARNTQQAFADFLFDPFDGGVKGMIKSFADAMRRMAANALALRFFGPETSFGKFFAGLFHTGGIAGHAGTRRAVSPWAFVGAPRFHSGGKALGLSADESPAILQRGERVLNLEETRDYERGTARLAGVLGVEEGLVFKHLESPGFTDLLVRKLARDPAKFRSAMGV